MLPVIIQRPGTQKNSDSQTEKVQHLLLKEKNLLLVIAIVVAVIIDQKDERRMILSYGNKDANVFNPTVLI